VWKNCIVTSSLLVDGALDASLVLLEELLVEDSFVPLEQPATTANNKQTITTVPITFFIVLPPKKIFYITH
jgi:hypothetical protein